MGRGSSGNPSSMRGLVQFIADLRNARARELEEKRINKELANIRQKYHVRHGSAVFDLGASGLGGEVGLGGQEAAIGCFLAATGI